MFAYNAFCLIIYLFPESTSVYTKYKVLMLHHGVTESSPSGRCQQYFSSGRHLAAAARVPLSTIPAGMGQLRNPFRQRAGRRPRWRPTYLLKLDHFSLLSINGLQYHIQPPLNSRKFLIRILRTRPKTYDNSVNTFQANQHCWHFAYTKLIFGFRVSDKLQAVTKIGHVQ